MFKEFLLRSCEGKGGDENLHVMSPVKISNPESQVSVWGVMGGVTKG